MRVIFFLVLAIAAVSADPANTQRIVGGSVTTISEYPHIAALLYTYNWNSWIHDCGGTILNPRSVLTAAHCTFRDEVPRWRVRVGSTSANSGGAVHILADQFIHPNFDRPTFESDIAILRTAIDIVYTNVVQPVFISGPNYNVADNEVVWAAGWGATFSSGWNMETLRHVQVWTINRELCRTRYTGINYVSDTMICSGVLNVGGRDQCSGDSGGPLYHNGVQVGITSWGQGCGSAIYPGVNTLVSRFTTWIEANA